MTIQKIEERDAFTTRALMVAATAVADGKSRQLEEIVRTLLDAHGIALPESVD